MSAQSHASGSSDPSDAATGGGSGSGSGSGASDDGEDVSVLLDSAKRQSISRPYFPITALVFSAVNSVVSSVVDAATGSGGSESISENKMTVDDFVAAVEIDDVLIQAIQFSQRKRILRVFTSSGDLTKLAAGATSSPDS